ncbi:hypothetical protein ANO14919_133980 [Xylariales sp. No.14919]|nr:hypothetical protein ANO14919_133980 [Xylariales sp. No.14919]
MSDYMSVFPLERCDYHVRDPLPNDDTSTLDELHDDHSVTLGRESDEDDENMNFRRESDEKNEWPALGCMRCTQWDVRSHDDQFTSYFNA